MNIEEFCAKYGYSESTVRNKWAQVQKTIQKKTGILIEKSGRGSKVKFTEIFPDDRALTMFDETKDTFIMDRSAFSYENIEFTCFLAVVLTTYMTFRGDYEDLLRYMMIPITPENKIKVKAGMESLRDRGIIYIYYDTSVERELFTISIVGKAEDEMKVGIDMVKTCKRIAEENNKQSWVPLLKTWLGMQIMSEEQPFTIAQLETLTGLSPYQIRESKKLLESNDLFKTTKAYQTFSKCIGQNIELNGFYN